MPKQHSDAARRRSTPQQGVSEAEFARQIGVSQPAINMAKKKGKLVLFPDGSIDPEASIERYYGETDLEQSERGRALAGPRANHAMQYLRAKTINQAISAQVAREKLARMRGEVVDRRQAQQIVFSLAREERNALLALPARIAPLIAAELGEEGRALDIHRVQTCLERHFHSYLSELPDIREEELFPDEAAEDEEEGFGEEGG